MNTFNAAGQLNKLTPRDLVRKHIMDRNHVVTEEELNTLQIGILAEDATVIKIEAQKLEDESKQPYRRT